MDVRNTNCSVALFVFSPMITRIISKSTLYKWCGENTGHPAYFSGLTIFSETAQTHGIGQRNRLTLFTLQNHATTLRNDAYILFRIILFKN